jgi:hypothetical protein
LFICSAPCPLRPMTILDSFLSPQHLLWCLSHKQRLKSYLFYKYKFIVTSCETHTHRGRKLKYVN